MNRFLLLLVLFLFGCSKPSGAQPILIAHPDNAQASVEYFEQRPSGKGPWPTVIFLHGQQGPTQRKGGRVFVDWGVLSNFAKDGYLAVSVSLPGYGGSTGSADFAGPFTQNAVRAVIAKLEADGLAAPDRVLIQGTSLGAVTAALVGAKEPKLAGLVLISGLYDLPTFFTQPKSMAAAAIKGVAIEQTGGSDAALASRSALRVANRIRANTLILNGGEDERTDPDQAWQFAAAINQAGGKASVHVYDGAGHEIPIPLREAEIRAHIDKVLRR